MKSRFVTTGIAGVIAGLLSTYPVELRPLPSFTLWIFFGMLIGALRMETRQRVYAGIMYGMGLSIAFLFSRFGGTKDQLPAYMVLVALFCIPGVFGGILTTWMGATLRRLMHR